MAIASTARGPATAHAVGDRDSRVTDIFAAHADLVFATCYGILRDREEASDASQETFVRALRSVDSIPDDPRPWLRVVARNYCYDLLRSRRRQAALTAGLARSLNPGANPELQALDRWILSRALGSLKPRDRAALWDALVEERPMTEVAGRLGLSYMGAAQVVHRARRRALKVIRDLSTGLAPLLRWETGTPAGLGRASAAVAGVLLPALLVIGAGSIPDGRPAPYGAPASRPPATAGSTASTSAPVPPDSVAAGTGERASRGAIDGLPDPPGGAGAADLPSLPDLPDLTGTAGGPADLAGGVATSVVSELPQPVIPVLPAIAAPLPSLPVPPLPRLS